ncbi:atp3 gamma subunit of the F1 sector of mitochondrial F1F0 ATP synthase [Linnemannia hyalina]|uniref:ATP synthase subunit gamma n=1 Tax=Linnemannia hyalina TaxID=64524 RepID=A0A9P7Y763_9FUNG|nr:atp3 gamma subunit of the F1 sector of mitochondrial F1F0 ATP synthase [Linnemannia hyalina]
MVQMRLNAIRNIGKITKSMKMIASTKVAKAQRAMETARAYGATSASIYKNANTAPLENEDKVYIVSSSDRGLCGGIHSSVAKATRRLIAVDGPSSGVIVLGDKAKNQMSRSHRSDIQMSFNQIGKAIPTFAEASAAADTIKSSGIKFDTATIIYNEFTSAIAYEAKPINVYSSEALKAAGTSFLSFFCITVSSFLILFFFSLYLLVFIFLPQPCHSLLRIPLPLTCIHLSIQSTPLIIDAFAAYEIDDEVLENYHEFLFANNIYWGLVEGHASEMSAKRTAMENATKNAGEMVDRLTMTYNRSRQAAITSELVDIITGASAL